MHSAVQAGVIYIESLYSADLKKVLGAYSDLIDIFVNYYDVKERSAFISNARFLIKMTITNRIMIVVSSTFSVE